MRWGFPLPTPSSPLDFRVRAFPNHTTLPCSKCETEGPPNTKGHQHGVFSFRPLTHAEHEKTLTIMLVSFLIQHLYYIHLCAPSTKRHQHWCLFVFGTFSKVFNVQRMSFTLSIESLLLNDR